MADDTLPDAGTPALRDHETRTVATIRATTTPDRIGKTLEHILPAVWEHLAGLGIEPAGPPFVLYHQFGETVDLEGGVAVATIGVDTDQVRFSTLPGARVATIWHAGSYDSLKESWERLHEWIAVQGLTHSSPCWEVYWTDPSATPNVDDWRTEILWAVT